MIIEPKDSSELNEYPPQKTRSLDQLKSYILKHCYQESHDTPFRLASGEYSPYYLDLKRLLLNPEYLLFACRVLLEKLMLVLHTPPAALAGLTMGADPLVYGISLIAWQQKMKIMPLVVRKKEKDHGGKKKIEGNLENLNRSDEIVLIDDVITTGGSTLKAHQALLDASFKPKNAFCLVDREEGSRENFEKENIRLYSLFTLKDFRA